MGGTRQDFILAIPPPPYPVVEGNSVRFQIQHPFTVTKSNEDPERKLHQNDEWNRDMKSRNTLPIEKWTAMALAACIGVLLIVPFLSAQTEHKHPDGHR